MALKCAPSDFLRAIGADASPLSAEFQFRSAFFALALLVPKRYKPLLKLSFLADYASIAARIEPRPDSCPQLTIVNSVFVGTNTQSAQTCSSSQGFLLARCLRTE